VCVCVVSILTICTRICVVIIYAGCTYIHTLYIHAYTYMHTCIHTYTFMFLILFFIIAQLADAMNHLGDMYYKGTGVPKDLSKAKEWYVCIYTHTLVDTPSLSLSLLLLSLSITLSLSVYLSLRRSIPLPLSLLSLVSAKISKKRLSYASRIYNLTLNFKSQNKTIYNV